MTAEAIFESFLAIIAILQDIVITHLHYDKTIKKLGYYSQLLFFYFTVMSVKGVNFGHMSKLRLPSEAATASENWANFTNRVEIPSLDLMEHMQQGGDAQILFLSFKSLHALLPPPQDNQDKDLRYLDSYLHIFAQKMSDLQSGKKFLLCIRVDVRKCIWLCFECLIEFLMMIFEMAFVFHKSKQA